MDSSRRPRRLEACLSFLRRAPKGRRDGNEWDQRIERDPHAGVL